MPDDKTVIRGGYGILWDSSEGREIDDSVDIYPYSIRSSLSPTNNPAAALSPSVCEKPLVLVTDQQ